MLISGDINGNVKQLLVYAIVIVVPYSYIYIYVIIYIYIWLYMVIYGYIMLNMSAVQHPFTKSLRAVLKPLVVEISMEHAVGKPVGKAI